jgi:hypothetical protein
MHGISSAEKSSLRQNWSIRYSQQILFFGHYFTINESLLKPTHIDNYLNFVFAMLSDTALLSKLAPLFLCANDKTLDLSDTATAVVRCFWSMSMRDTRRIGGYTMNELLTVNETNTH